MNKPQLFTSGSDEWTTPTDLFAALHREFRFRFDMAASSENFLLPLWYGPTHTDPQRMNGLHLKRSDDPTDWRRRRFGFCNPPYSRGLQSQFIAACAQRGSMVMLLPARTDTLSFHKYIYDVGKWQARRGVEIRFLKGRLRFGGAKHGAPFPSMIVIFK